VSVDRPTFSESWYRVAPLCPRLRPTVQVHRQHFRGQMWHVLQDPSSNQFSRLSDSAYRFVAMLDGRRSVADVWKVCNEQLGDAAPTQGEAIQLLGQLYTSNLLLADLPPDAEGLFRRYRQRRVREVQSYLMNLLFIRIPLIDPDHFLNRWVGLFGHVFSWVGLAVWVVLLGVGLHALVGRWTELGNRASGVLDVANLPLLYACLVAVKVIHEFGHAFACKRFGQLGGSGGEVHAMGVMFLIFAPVPYVDASSAWAFRSKWHRTVVGASGMMVELAIASVAAVVWANTAAGHPVNAIAYNVIFIASVSSLLFNGNPLLRFDGYYILSDLIEIPNLAQRSKDYLYYLVRRYAWSVKRVTNPAHTDGEKAWFVFYGIASAVYRVFISIRILLFVADKLFFVGAVMAVSGLAGWVVVPLVRFARYLVSSGELIRVRGRATASTLVTAAVIVGTIGLIPAPDRFRLEGVAEPASLAIVHAAADGFIQEALPSGTSVRPDGPPLVKATNVELESHLSELEARRRGLEARRREAVPKDPAAAQAYAEQIAAMEDQITRARRQLADLEIRAPFAGLWVSPQIDQARGAYAKRGDRLGAVISEDRMIVRAVAGQTEANILTPVMAYQNLRSVDIRVKGRPDLQISGRIQEVLPAGQQELPSQSLGIFAGGGIPTDDTQGAKAAERLFEVRIAPDPASPVHLLAGQRVAVRVRLTDQPLAAQAWRGILQLIQKRFHL
jgi:putative peptide zinc metalloprotease protein